ncbi:FtsX-like permease family protein [Halomarina halobia]|uniref:ABC transporter permease n=1 Tax=Halomarina halobia TaxID=3033386 RepID=UPI0023E892F4|nr:ABC transporter permease [Halomarina sp. PSR21]
MGILISSITRMSVRDRRDDLRALYATGASPGRLARLFAARAGLLAAVGGTIGYALGVVVPNALVNLTLTLGYPVALDLALGPTAGLLVAGLVVGVAVVGAVAGYLAARSTLRGSVLPDGASGGAARSGGALSLRLLSPRAFLPTAGSLAVFVAFVVLVGTVGATFTAIGATGGTITEPDAIHPVASHVDQRHATVLRSEGVEASPEILLFTMVDGEPVFGRGVNYTAYAAVSDGRLVEGRPPNGPGEAIVGESLADRLDVRVGESILLGGSTATGLTTVTVTGVYSGEGLGDDQLLVPLDTARYLRDLPSGTVNLIRVGSDPSAAFANASGIVALDVTAPDRVRAGEPVPVNVSLQNVGDDTATRTVEVAAGSAERSRTVTLDPGERTTVTVALPSPPPGTWNLTAADRRTRLAVVDEESPRIEGVPERLPPGATFTVGVRTAAGEPASNATVALDGDRAPTDGNGSATLAAPDAPGTYRLAADVDGATASRRVTVSENATREPVATLRVSPSTEAFGSATARVRLVNPWDRPVTRSVRVEGPERTRAREVRLAPGERTTFEAPLSRQPPGTYAVSLRVGDAVVAEQRYEVTGDRRLAGALASSGYSAGSDAGSIVERSFGNLWVVLGTIVAQGAFMSIGSTTAAFAGAVHARRRSVGVRRATGMSPRRLLRLVLRDALVLAIPASLFAVAAGVSLVALVGALGALTVFGVGFTVVTDPVVLGGTALVALALAVASAAVVARRFARATPAELLGGDG